MGCSQAERSMKAWMEHEWTAKPLHCHFRFLLVSWATRWHAALGHCILQQGGQEYGVEKLQLGWCWVEPLLASKTSICTLSNADISVASVKSLRDVEGTSDWAQRLLVTITISRHLLAKRRPIIKRLSWTLEIFTEKQRTKLKKRTCRFNYYKRVCVPEDWYIVFLLFVALFLKTHTQNSPS